MMEFHISRFIRDRIDLDDLLFSYSGNVIFVNVTASRRLAEQLNLMDKGGSASEKIHGAALFAMGLIDELSHALIASYRRRTDPQVYGDAIRFVSAHTGPEQLDNLLLTFTDQFPNTAVYRNELTAAHWLSLGSEGIPNREVAFEELTLLWLANTNPAFAPFKVLFDDQILMSTASYPTAISVLPDYFRTRPVVESGLGTLLEALRAPMLASPDSLTGQLEYIREHWAPALGDDLGRLLLAIDVLREEEIAIWMRFHPPGDVWHRHGEPGGTTDGFVGDEFVGFDQERTPRHDDRIQRRYAEDYQAPLNEYEAFSADQAWMPTVVLIAKNTYVWLEQLSKKYGRHIHRLDQIPDEELQLLAERGITGLWLIGLWERSIASRTIKRLRGNNEAVASAYSLKNYTIAEDLGGDAAFHYLKQRASIVGLRLASDMVPNHMGIDSDWVIEHPDWFLSRGESPFPAYRFEGPDISTDSRVEIKIEDHYYDHSDAAVVFRLRHHANAITRFIYHGNDGTAFAWNDTAQLDYLKSEVREHVIQVILEVARRFPIIRFDAAMVLAKRHVQRLWFPLPGAGGSIPSRAENALSDEAFNALMPHEFWREVVDRVAAEVPGTLLLAEAFWLLEGYFVRTLGMHRVYNSAFMNMLRDEENAKYRSYLKKTVEFDPDILKRYVNFMSNPDERTAIDQFGSGDKYFGVSVLLATLPGLPMFGHGQIEGFTERYGMDFQKARLDEYPNDDLIARHDHLIAPLLKSRYLFAESEHFLLYDFWNDHGKVDENVFAYSNRRGNERALILYNNCYQSTRGTIHYSVGFLDKRTGALQYRPLADGLNLPDDNSVLIAYRDNVLGLEYLRYAADLRHHGLAVSLRGYQHVALIKWRELQPTAAQPWNLLCDALHGAGVYSIDEALAKLQLRPLLETLRQAVSTETIERFATLSRQVSEVPRKSTISIKSEEAPSNNKQPSADLDHLQVPPLLADFVEQIHQFTDQILELAETDGELSPNFPKRPFKAPASEENLLKLMHASLALPALLSNLSSDLQKVPFAMLFSPESTIDASSAWARILTWLVLQAMPLEIEPFQIFEQFNLRWALAETFSSVGIEGEGAWEGAAQIRLLLKFEGEDPMQIFKHSHFWDDPDVRWLVGVNRARGKEYINQERFEEILFWMQLPQLLECGTSSNCADAFDVISQLTEHCIRSLRLANFEFEEFLYRMGIRGDQALLELTKPPVDIEPAD